jgi:hypothetical protein
MKGTGSNGTSGVERDQHRHDALSRARDVTICLELFVKKIQLTENDEAAD